MSGNSTDKNYSDKQYDTSYTGPWLELRQGVFTCVGWQVTLCDPTSQVRTRSSETELYSSQHEGRARNHNFAQVNATV